jgi:glycyl-tRNA synthetase beta chain
MTITKNLLVELLVEELPPKTLKKLGETFAEGVLSGLESRDFLEPTSVMKAFASPRRLAVHITDVRAVSQPRPQPPRTLMPVSVGLDSGGKPTAPLLKRLRSMYGDEADVQRIMDERVFIEDEGGKKVLKHREGLATGAQLFAGLEAALADSLEGLPIAKVMTYQLKDGWSTAKFVRPAHGLVALHGGDIVPMEILGLKSGRETQGHRFEAVAAKIKLKNADTYESQMKKEGAVIASFTARRDEILKQITVAAAKENLTPVGDEDLLNEVTALVERPNVLVGKFEKEFLEVPQECLILTMKANQKYFPLLDAKGKLTNKFLVVSNIRPKDAGLVISGNERVVRPRLADAKFFFDQDRKKPLDSRVLGLSKVVYHNKLGNQGERVERVQAIARAIGKQLGGDALALQADQAALLAKADLLTDMVGEFPELQGIMGRYYAQHDGLSDDIAFAIEDHYKPRFAGDELPRSMVGICVALADKLETLLGMFGIGEIPTGDQDRFALRRHALGVIRMLIEKDLGLSIDTLVQNSFTLMQSPTRTLGPNEEGTYALQKDTPVSVLNFIYERLNWYLREQGYSVLEVEAVLVQRPQHLSDVPRRLAAVRAFASLPEAAALAAANKRVGNILKKEGIGATVEEVDDNLLQEPAEKTLHQALDKIASKADTAFAAGNYTASLQALAALRVPVDDFFDNVMVNAEDAALRTNRLALLSQLHQAMNRVADISKLAA